MVEYRQVLTGKLTLNTGTFSNIKLDLPALSSKKQAFIIHGVEFDFGSGAVVAGKHLTLQLTKKNEVELIDADGDSLIAQLKKLFITAVGAIDLKEKQEINPVEMLPKSSLYFGGKQDSGASVVVTIRIFYTIRWVNQDQINTFIMENQ